MTPDDDIENQRHRLYLRDMWTIFFAVLIIVTIEAVMVATHQVVP